MTERSTSEGAAARLTAAELSEEQRIVRRVGKRGSVNGVAPTGCSVCGISDREHMQRYKPPVGWHQWTAPTQEQIKARMLSRRSGRTRT